MRFVLGAKPGDHKALFEWVEPWEAHPPADPAKRGVRWETVDGDGTTHCFRWLNGVPLNDTHFDLEVNFLDSRERRRNGKERRFSWVTDLRVEPCNAMKRMRAGRARWRIENETFNTLKNQGDEFEHNFGHGEKNLATVFAALMMLAFAIDQVRKMCCAPFRAALARKKRAKYFRRDLRALFMSYRLPDWETLYRALAFGHHAPVPVAHDTSQARRRAASRSQPPCRFRESTSPPAASGPRPEGRRCPAHSAPEGCAGSPDIRTLGGNRCEAVIGLAPNLFYGTGIPASLLVLNRDKPAARKGKVLFIDASGEFEEGSNQNRLRDRDVEHVARTFHAFAGEEKYARVVPLAEVEHNDWNLNISRYVDTSEEEERIDVAEAVRKLRALERERAAAEATMNRYLAELGYDV